MLSRLARILLTLALLAGWQAALLHPLEHFDKHGSFVHLADGHSGDKKSGKSVLCDALAALAACAGDAAVGSLCIDCRQQSIAPEHAELRRAQAPPFLSQGPPAVL